MPNDTSEIKPVAWARQGSITSLAKRYSDRESVNHERSEEQHFLVPLYALPATHRIVSVDALSSILEMAGIILVAHEPFDSPARKHFAELCAIIDKEPT